MLENLLNLVKENAGSAIINNPEISNEHNDAAIATASSSIVDGLKNAVSNGNIDDIMNLFKGDNIQDNTVAQGIQGNFISELMNKFGLNEQSANGIAGGLLPSVIQQFVHKTNDPNDSSFDISNIIQNIGGGNLDIQSIISNFTGSDSNSSNGGGILDSLKGLFGK